MARNNCKEIDDFYTSLATSNKYATIMAHNTIGIFGGTRSSYTFPLSVGIAKVIREYGIARMFLHGSARGNSENIQPEGTKFIISAMTPITVDGKCTIVTPFTTSQISLPLPTKL
jgi:hypothetical protein